MAKKGKRAARKEAPNLTIPPRIFAQASPCSPGGVSLFEAQDQIRSDTVPYFFSGEEILRAAAQKLKDAGFEILQVSAITINIAGTAETYEKAFQTKIYAEERPVIKEMATETVATFLDSPDTKIPGLIATKGTAFEDVLEGVALEEPRYFMQSAFPPLRQYWHLDVPAGVSLATNADRAHRGGITGRGIRVAMVDSGWFRHPFFTERGYRAAPVVLGPAAANPLDDESGHGTGESANIFSVAPDVELLPVKVNFVNSIGAFNAAVGLAPDIITCSWGSSVMNGPLSAANQALAAAIAAAVASGIIVVFSAGNGHWGFPGQHPDVISAGGTFMDVDGSLRASDYASGFMSNIYPNRRVPDLCGLVGMQPKAIYIMLPIQPGDSIDSTPWNAGGLQGGTHPNGDETANNDGWGAFSGTSAAAPQLAGAAALIKQACPSLTPADVRDILMKTARDVIAGNCNPSTGGNPATVGPDTATGNGLVDAHKAVMMAKVRCLGPIVPITIKPIVVQPVIPIEPITPTPIKPIVPVLPITPIKPITPIVITPIKPIIPPISPVVLPSPESKSMAGMGPERTESAPQQKSKLSNEDVKALEDMIMDSDVDIDK